MAQQFVTTREDFLFWVSEDAEKLENEALDRVVYYFDTHKGGKGAIGFEADNPLPSLEIYEVAASVAMQSAQAFLSAAA